MIAVVGAGVLTYEQQEGRDNRPEANPD